MTNVKTSQAPRNVAEIHAELKRHADLVAASRAAGRSCGISEEMAIPHKGKVYKWNAEKQSVDIIGQEDFFSQLSNERQEATASAVPSAPQIGAQKDN
jgi:hypothetical protein